MIKGFKIFKNILIKNTKDKSETTLPYEKNTKKDRQQNILDELPNEVRSICKKHINSITDILIDNHASHLATEIIYRLLDFVWSLPASESHHHSSPFGLFLHSLETALNNLKFFESKLFFQYKDGMIDSYETRKSKPKEQYAYFLSGLLCSVGEAAQVVIHSTPTQEEELNPKLKHLVSYLSEFKNELSNTSDAQMKFETMMSSIKEAALQGSKEFTTLQTDEFSVDDLNIRAMYAHFLAGLLHDIGKAAEFLVKSEQENTWCPLKEGLRSFYERNNGMVQIKYLNNKTYVLHKKMASAFAALLISSEDYQYIGVQNYAELMDFFSQHPSISNKYKKTIASDMESTDKNVTASQPRGDVAVILIDKIREILISGRYPFNSNMPGAWILEDYTAVAIKILDEARIAATNDERIKRTIDFKMLMKSLVERKFVKAEDWKCVYLMDIETSGRPFQQKVIMLKNNILWKESVPERCKLKLSFNISSKD